MVVVHFPERIRLPREAYSNPEAVFHLTINAHAQIAAWNGRVRKAIWQAVLEIPERGDIELVAACLMPDHLHLLAKPVGSNLLNWLNSWKSWTTRQSWKVGHRGPLWQPGMWDRTIRSEEDLLLVVRYILENPVRAGLVQSFGEWQFTYCAEM